MTRHQRARRRAMAATAICIAILTIVFMTMPTRVDLQPVRSRTQCKRFFSCLPIRHERFEEFPQTAQAKLNNQRRTIYCPTLDQAKQRSRHDRNLVASGEGDVAPSPVHRWADSEAVDREETMMLVAA